MYVSHHSDVDYLDTWKAMEKLVDLGLVKSIGISNFNSQQIDRLLANCRIKPVTNQVNSSEFFGVKISFFSCLSICFHVSLVIEFDVRNGLFSKFFRCVNNIKFQIEASPQINQKKLIKFCQDRDIIVTAYCPLGRPIPAEKKPGFLYDAKLIEIGKKYGKTPAQIVFRYLVSGNI